jgi:signal transduction histidine kinase/ActR/RegA family two-component response regulator
MANDWLPGGRRAFVSTLPAGPDERRLALAVVLASVAIFLTAVPFAKTPLGQLWSFIPIYQSALAVNDLITAVLLFGQFRFLRSRALLVLAGGYLFTAVMAVLHMLTFPGLFAPTGLLGAGPQTTAWLFMFWHGGFPLCVVVYALLKDTTRETGGPQVRPGVAILGSIAAVPVAAGALTLLATAGQAALPVIMRGNHYTPAMLGVVSSTWVLSLLALMVLWRRRPHSVLDLWLMVVMSAWIFDIALAAVLNAGRFDLGFYAGRIYGLLAASFVLMVLLIENGKLYIQLGEAYDELDRQNRSLEHTVRERTDRLLQSEKVATMGSLLAGVAHELNNPLAVVLGQAMLLRESAAGSPFAARGDKIHTAAERCARIVKNFLALARNRPPERAPVALNSVVTQAVELLGYELRTSAVEVDLRLSSAIPVFQADGHQLHQVIVNLIANAHYAMRQSAGPRRITLASEFDAAAARVRLTITDAGPGIPPDVQARIFEPFFTTKPPGEGTGLGLSLCRAIAQEHGGTLTVESEPGHGATFIVTLPATAVAGVSAVDAAAPATPVTPKRILVVDDEPDIAATLVETLEHDGHKVDVAADGAEALASVQRQDYDVIVTDTKVPRMDGPAFYRELARRRPALARRVVFLTGDLMDREKREWLESIGNLTLAKPFDVNDIRRAVHRALEAAT